jgi:hypothetical protein
MLEEIIKSAKSHIYERLFSPIMGSFVVAWSLWNYKFLVILFSSASITQTFKMIDTLAFPNSSALFLRGFLFPALTAAVYIFLYPYPAKFVFGFTRRRQKEINDLRRTIEDETPLTLEESRKIRAVVAQIENEHSQEIDRKNREIDRLKSEIDGLSSPPIESSPKTSLEPSLALDPRQLAMLRLIEKLMGRAPESVLLEKSKHSKVKNEYDLGELVNFGLLTRKYDAAEQDYVFEFTHKGRTYLVTHSNEK